MLREGCYVSYMKAELITAFIILLFNTTSCKPQKVITDRESSAILELQDSLMISETQIALINTITNHLRNEDFNLNNETVIHEIEYGADSRISSERFIKSNTQLEKETEDYEIYSNESLVESNNQLRKSSYLQKENNEIQNEKRKQRNVPLNFKIGLVVGIGVILGFRIFNSWLR